MSDQKLAGWQHAGRFCSECEAEITAADVVDVNEDAEYDGDGWHDLTTIKHVQCPESLDGDALRGEEAQAESFDQQIEWQRLK
jgi:hypothetical protein